ncbi:MAG: J domain-containing protein [Bauldia sp.]
MKLNSKLFDSIRIKPEAQEAFAEGPLCETPGCVRPGEYRAPKGRLREGQYFHFCLDHVRDYNKRYNYFAGMAEADIDAYRVDAATGHRPTWTMGAQGGKARTYRSEGGDSDNLRDVFGILNGGPGFTAGRTEAPRQRPLHNSERASFAVLDLEGGEKREEIKARFKSLVKLLHPDANGGDRSSEDRLREIIQAYNHLKAAGFC